MTNHVVTVLMPAYNASLYIREAIDSILSQTFSEFKFLIINDGSTDDTEEIILSYNDERIWYERNEKNLGLVETLAKGVNLISSEYIIRMDADDISLQTRIEDQLNFMNERKEIAVSGAFAQMFGDTERLVKMPTNHNEIMAHMVFACPLIHPTTIIRTSFLKEHKLNYRLPERVKGNGYIWPEDYDLWNRISHFGKLANLDKCVLKYRYEGQNISLREFDKLAIRYKNIFTEIFKDLNIEPTAKNLDIHYEFSKFKHISHKSSDYKNWKTLLLSKWKEKKQLPIKQFIKELEKRSEIFFYFYTEKQPIAGIRFLRLSEIKFKFLRYFTAQLFHRNILIVNLKKLF